MNIRDFRHQVEVQTRTETKDSHGQRIFAWATTSTIWARVQTLTGRKLELARQIDAEATVQVGYRYCGTNGVSGITIQNRFKHGARIFEPIVIINENELNISMVATCKEAVDG